MQNTYRLRVCLKRSWLDDKAKSEEFTQKQATTALELAELAEQEIRIHKKLGKPEVPQENNGWWQIRNKIRGKLQEAVLLGMLDIREFQGRLVNCGAFPDPEHDYKYYCMPNGRFACWCCGSVIMGKSVAHPVRDGLFPCSGSGETQYSQVPFCPHCDKEPLSTGMPVLEKSPYDDPVLRALCASRENG